MIVGAVKIVIQKCRISRIAGRQKLHKSAEKGQRTTDPAPRFSAQLKSSVCLLCQMLFKKIRTGAALSRREAGVADSLSDHAAHTESAEHQQESNSKHGGKQNNFCAPPSSIGIRTVFSLCRVRFAVLLFFTVVFLAVVWVCFFFAVPEAEVFFFVFPLPFVVFAMQNFSPFSYYSRKYPAMENVDKKTVQSKIFQFPFFHHTHQNADRKVTGKCRHENADQIYRMKNNFYFFPIVQFQRSLPR